MEVNLIGAYKAFNKERSKRREKQKGKGLLQVLPYHGLYLWPSAALNSKILVTLK